MFLNRSRSTQLLRETHFENLDAMFVGILMRDLARDCCVEFDSSRHRAIFEISSRTVEKL